VSIPRVALRVPDRAAVALDVSPDYFDKHIRPELRLIRRGRLVLVAVDELQRWCREAGERTMDNGH
jgi:hypothetical protein